MFAELTEIILEWIFTGGKELRYTEVQDSNVQTEGQLEKRH